MSVKQVSNNAEVDERLTALITNANAIRAIASAVEGTLGPKGLDTMLVDKFGDVVITNDGVTILQLMEVNHPAARMLIKTAKAQQAEIGDGTTTATVLAGSLVSEGVEQAHKGVPVSRVIEGLKSGVKSAVDILARHARPVESIDDPYLNNVALVAGREHTDIADLVVSAARLVGLEKLKENGFKLSDSVFAQEGAENLVFSGVIINKRPLSEDMPKALTDAPVLIIDDALEPEELSSEALSTEAGFAWYREKQQEFLANIRKIIDMGVRVVLVDRGVEDIAQEMLTDAGILVVQRVSSRELKKAAEHTGARAVKRTGLLREPADLNRYLGRAGQVLVDDKLEHVRIMAGQGKPVATVLVGAATEEVVGERERIAKDAASAVQAAVKGGLIPGGGAIELAVARQVEEVRRDMRGMSAYGLDCVVTALKRPFAQIVANAGFNPLEKLGDVIAAQMEQGKDTLSINCDNGEVADMWEMGVIDPALVKIHALRAAGEIAEAILRINTIIKKREQRPEHMQNESGEGSW
ncbi:TCP-1/cpn60 chaperonin family protein [Heliophilum fasciatum]|uniref:Chaperonin GroEL (HSP60 family) n=1 Tax=Heliophilum fasciatum TaxID=35700 RepID=A0A4R2RMM2_9FIRM|nr:TCP-1/cpn60 chaperonin family protein [Heliophilum fasciatum]MCW2278128.1 chaperonin GroEL (HSP60 family) [Heliophilum fasciatum]TCP64198.1 chaperonin GroEL (HSP60 family) [Heliophilum fasciatum]